MSSLHKDHRDVLIAPVVSEKSYGLLDANKYTFLVHPDANKTEIKIAVEKVFDVKVTSVNTINRQGKTRRTRYGLGKRPNTKRAIVSLAEGHRIDIFGGPVSGRSVKASARASEIEVDGQGAEVTTEPGTDELAAASVEESAEPSNADLAASAASVAEVLEPSDDLTDPGEPAVVETAEPEEDAK